MTVEAKEQGPRQRAVNKAARILQETLEADPVKAHQALNVLWVAAELHACRMDELYGDT